jgi:hypothetical protein
LTARHEGSLRSGVDSRRPAQICEPVHGEQAFDADDEALTKRCHGPQEDLGTTGTVLIVDNLAVVIEANRLGLNYVLDLLEHVA